ncbi:MAG: ABC transporter permease [Actinomycetota bacterium]
MTSTNPTLVGPSAPVSTSRANEVLRAVSDGTRARRRRTLLTVWGGSALLGAALLLFWEFGAGLVMNTRYVSSPSEVFDRLVELASGELLWNHIAATMTEAGTGYLIGVAVGLFGAFVLVSLPMVEEVFSPFLIAFYSIPKIALAPLFIMWFGFGYLPKILLAALMVFLIVLVNSVTGIKSISPGLVEVSRVLGAGGLQLARKVILPGAAPAIMASIRITFSRAMVGAILAEFIAATEGLGFLIVRASRQFDTPTVFAGIVVIAVLVMSVNGLIRLLERRLLPWNVETVHG